MNCEQEKQIDDFVEQYLDSIGVDNDYPGYIELFWRTKKENIKKLYNIDWMSPSDLDSETIFN